MDTAAQHRTDKSMILGRGARFGAGAAQDPGPRVMSRHAPVRGLPLNAVIRGAGAPRSRGRPRPAAACAVQSEPVAHLAARSDG